MSFWNTLFGPEVPEGMEEYPVGSGNFIKKSELEHGKSADPNISDFQTAPEFDLAESIARNSKGVFDFGFGFVKWIVIGLIALAVIVLFIRR